MRLFSALIFGILSISSCLNAQTDADDFPQARTPRAAGMPYNRDIHSAGKVLTFGDPRLENHTLDVCLLPDPQYLALEDRYGVAILHRKQNKRVARWSFPQSDGFKELMSTFSGIKSFEWQNRSYLVWGAGGGAKDSSGIMVLEWNNLKLLKPRLIFCPATAPSPMALPNEVEVRLEAGIPYLYVALNGNNQVQKIRFSDQKIMWTSTCGVAPYGLELLDNKVFVSNWAGPVPRDTKMETAGVPWGEAYVNPKTGATSKGTVAVLDAQTGNILNEIEVGLHPNALVISPDKKMLYVANGNDDNLSAIDLRLEKVRFTIPVGLFPENSRLVGSTPNGLAFSADGQMLYVSNGLDHALACVRTGDSPQVLGYIPTEAYPAGLTCIDNTLYVCNLEALGAGTRNNTRLLHQEFPLLKKRFRGAQQAHEQYASLSIIPVPNTQKLAEYTQQVQKMAKKFRTELANQMPRPEAAPRPVPERTGEPSVFKHVIYIIKENRTFDQVYGDLEAARGMPALCIYGDSVTPNQHKLALQYCLLDGYHVSGKCSAEGHQWTDAGIVSDYVEKSVRAWFRSYPHRQYDALVYTREGFIWNHAEDHGKKARIYGEACDTEFDKNLSWTDIYSLYVNKQPFQFKNTSTISRVRPLLSQTYPGYDDPRINDQLRADALIADIHKWEAMPGDSMPALMLLSLPNDHTTGTTPGFPTPRAMVADNDLALGRIVEALTYSRFWENTVIFVTEDDSQGGWDHVSAYRSGALVISAYPPEKPVVHTAYNQTSMLRTIEQILGLPPMNAMDATAETMQDCFGAKLQPRKYTRRMNLIALNEMNPDTEHLHGRSLFYAKKSADICARGIDQGPDELFNRILWFAAKGALAYPGE